MTVSAVPATGIWLDAIPESSITPHVGDYRNDNFTVLNPGVSGEEKHLTDARIRLLLSSEVVPVYAYVSDIFQYRDDFLDFIKAFFAFKAVIFDDCFDFCRVW